MDFRAVVEILLSHCREAANDLDNGFKDVAFGHPLPGATGRSIRLYYGGEVEPPKMPGARVLNAELVGERLVIVTFWPLSNSRETYARTVETEVRALKHGLRTRIQGDAQLAALVFDLSLEYAEVDWGVVAGTVYRTLEIGVLLSYEEYPIVA